MKISQSTESFFLLHKCIISQNTHMPPNMPLDHNYQPSYTVYPTASILSFAIYEIISNVNEMKGQKISNCKCKSTNQLLGKQVGVESI